MSLGYARDSLANLLSLVHDEDNDHSDPPSGSGGNSNQSTDLPNDGLTHSNSMGGTTDAVSNEEDEEEEDFFFIDEEEGHDVPTSIPLVIAPTAGVVVGVIPLSTTDPSLGSAITQKTDNTAIPPPTGNNDKSKVDRRGAYQHAYKKLTYAGAYNYNGNNPYGGEYADYCPDPYAPSDLTTKNNKMPNYPGVGVMHHPNANMKNLFCCFTPFAKQKTNDGKSTDMSGGGGSGGSLSSDEEQFEDVNGIIGDVDNDTDLRSCDILSTGTDTQHAASIISGTSTGTNNSESEMLNTASSQIIESSQTKEQQQKQSQPQPKITVTSVDTKPNTTLPPPSPRVGLSQRTDSFSTAQSIASTYSSHSKKKEEEKEKEKETNETKTADETTTTKVVAPTTTTTTTTTTPSKPDNDKASTLIVKKRIPVTDAVPLKGILKKTSPVKLTMVLKDTATTGLGGGGNTLSTARNAVPTPARRNLFPTYQPRASITGMSTMSGGGSNHDDSETSVNSKVKKNVKFQPMSRVVTVKARGSMSFMEKCQIWWQKPDYDDFKKAARIIAKAMVEGGSEIWLQTSDSWGKQKLRQQKHSSRSSAGTSTFTPSYRKALKQYGVVVDDGDDNRMETGEDEEIGGDKWWCKFGHSRRGLEHIVSADEGRQRHRYVTSATNAVLAEQRRQRVSHKDPEKIGAISLRHTSWARELAFAAGAADEEAVRSKFCNYAKSRISHLHENLRVMNKMGANSSSKVGRLNAQFILSANPVVTSLILDENTRSSVSLRRGYRKSKSEKVFSSQQMRKLDEYRDANMEEKKEADISKVASGFGAQVENNMLLRYKV